MSNGRKFAEVTVASICLLGLPVAYYYGRPYVLGAQDQAYDKMFKIDEEQYKRVKELHRQSQL